jgi:hypothetical protein
VTDVPASVAGRERILLHLRQLGELVQSRVLDAARRGRGEDDLSRSVGERGGDTIYAIDVHAEEAIDEYCERWAQEAPFLLVAEGLPGGQRMVPRGTAAAAATFTLIADPIDGTRGLMYGKRSAWALFGVAPPPMNGTPPMLADIRIALQIELPTPRAAVADVLWAVRGGGVQGETIDLRDRTARPFMPSPSSATTIRGGFATVVKFFPGAKLEAARLEDELFAEVTGVHAEELDIFDDEYISNGGQLYELMAGHDRFIADLRPVLAPPGRKFAGLCAHPYDLCTWIIAAEAGVVVTDPAGETLSAPLDTETPVAWVGYANDDLRQRIQPVLQRLLQSRQSSSEWTRAHPE